MRNASGSLRARQQRRRRSGSGAAAARMRARMSACCCSAMPAALPADAATALARARAGGVALDVRPRTASAAHDLAIDALLGIGASRAPKGRLADDDPHASTGSTCPVLAIDVPSGLDADTGRPFGADCVRARDTLSLADAQAGLFTGATDATHAGRVWLDALGRRHRGAQTPDAWLAGTAARGSTALRRACGTQGQLRRRRRGRRRPRHGRRGTAGGARRPCGGRRPGLCRPARDACAHRGARSACDRS